MKRFICILLCALFMLSAFACAKKPVTDRPMESPNGQVKIYDSKDQQPEEAQEPDTEQTEPVETEPEKVDEQTEEAPEEVTEEPAVETQEEPEAKPEG